ncbi:MAG: excinuclease ABC subunit UvrA [Mariprofundales bacterium]
MIRIRGARVHNLRDISLDIPRNQLVVITGVSGSGKSSLAFDTLYAEGQRRYVESLSAYARQFLGMMERPDVDAIEGLSPAISIEQKSTSRNPRSTVGTITEIHDYLRLLFARIGQPFCHSCGKAITAQPASAIIDQLLALADGSKVQLLAPLARKRKGEFKQEIAQAAKDGFVRLRVDGEVMAPDEVPPLDKKIKHTIELVVDRLVIRDGIRTRLADSVETALKYGDGMLLALIGSDERVFSENFACADCGVSYPDIEPRLFSFNSPVGACPACDGLGTASVFDPELVIPDPSLPLKEAIAPWRGRESVIYRQTLRAIAAHIGVELATPYSDLDPDQRDFLLHGSGAEEVKFRFRTPGGRRYSVSLRFEGVLGELARRLRETSSEIVREELSHYINAIACEACTGGRLGVVARHVRLGGINLPQLCAMPLREAQAWLTQLDLAPAQRAIADKVVDEVNARLGFLINVGLDYLSLDRASGTLSGGESQRIRLATQIGSALVGVLYILDEPSIGLHQRDNDRLLTTLKHLRDLGNSVLVVEHDEDAIRAADWVIDMGPAAGEHGGEVVAAGTLETVLASGSLTADYMAGRRSITIPKRRRVTKKHPMIGLRGASAHNLKRVDVDFPIGRFSCITGVSGSGKSTLVLDSFYRALVRHLGLAMRQRVGEHTALVGAGKIDKVIDIDQSPIGRTPRSNPATYTGLFTPIRELFAKVPESRARGYKPGRFSFNVKGGRCEACQGDGIIKVEMHFLPDVYVHCDTCQGLRYNRETLDIRYKGKTIAEVLEMTVEQAGEFFHPITPLRKRLQTLTDVGLGYIRLGQQATTLSGGEAQRVKLAKELARSATGDTLYILDEPTTGLHFHDVAKLLEVLHALVVRGNTMLVIEHNLDVIKTADWIVDLGPEGGDRGGEIVVAGTPEQVAACEASWTGRYLQQHIKGKVK